MSKTVTFIGLGTMGYLMAEKLADKFPITIWNRSAEKANQLSSEKPNAKVASSLKEGLQSSEIIFLMVSDNKATESTLFPDGDESLVKGKTIFSMATLTSDQSIEHAKRTEKAGGFYIECPVLGSTPHVKSGQLRMLPTGPKDKIDAASYILQIWGKPDYIGETYGKSTTLKLALNQMIVSQIASMALSVKMVKENDLPFDLFSDIIRGSYVHCKYFDFKAEKMYKEEFDAPTFSISNLTKDTRNIIEELEKCDLESGTVQGVLKFAENAIKSGRGDSDGAALIAGIKKQ